MYVPLKTAKVLEVDKSSHSSVIDLFVMRVIVGTLQSNL